MIVTRLRLANLRAIESAEFRFQPGVNLIVGANGVGKTTVLQAISRGLAHAVGAAEGRRTAPPVFDEADIRHGSISANVTLDLHIGGSDVQVAEDWVQPTASAAHPGELASEVDVHAKDVRRRGRLRQAQREAMTTPVRRGGPKFLPDKAAFRQGAAGERTQLLSVLFSTTRAAVSPRAARKSRAIAASAAAYADAFVGRELGVGAFAEWVAVLDTTAHERDDAKPTLVALDKAVQRFLPGYLGLRVSADSPPRLLIDRTMRASVRADELPATARQQLVRVLRRMREHMDVNWPPTDSDSLPPQQLAQAAAEERRVVVDRLVRTSMPGFDALRGPLERVPAEISKPEYLDGFYSTLGPSFEIDQLPECLDVAQLSDGERGVLALVLDLTRRLAQGNPELSDPASEAEAIVLIDELELHLHPRWQRTVLQSLTATFPRCQLIATTHSPQVIGEVEHERIQVIADGQVYSPTHSYGVDSSRVLEEVMDSDPRAQYVQELLKEVSGAVGRQEFARGRELLAKLAERLGENDAEVTRIRTLLSFLEGKE